jgi:hypothetical protein
LPIKISKQEGQTALTNLEWWECSDPAFMYDWLRRNISPRKLRLIACACARRVCHLCSEWDRYTVEVAERLADGEGEVRATMGSILGETAQGRAICSLQYTLEVLDACFRSVYFASDAVALAAESSATGNREIASSIARRTERAIQCDLIRDIVGVNEVPSDLFGWNSGCVRQLAQCAYDDRDLPSGQLDTTRLAILADALEEAGCTDTDILEHCRSSGPHVRGCWVVDLLLGKE